MTKTEDNLKDAFVSESQANRRYIAYEKKAEQEGLKNISHAFRALAESEGIQANLFLQTSGLVSDTMLNLLSAIAIETNELSEKYPRFLRDAKTDNNETAATNFKFASEVTKVNANLLMRLIDELDKGEHKKRDFYVCSVCGNIEETRPEEKCVVCKAMPSSFKQVM